ncbi:ankyrin repeat-containing domain protein [Massariosphaeria phaeospora]|uniref:Ankyrin repeat-containing domain protein n=1 Tax=Massariosphaeria phaeospora TaxID=100035 RepID=A0A7C8MM71_9PLEO|nr:ankyrin repeat-containing domain protein [Massariosphaeria phaeospora]
MEVLNFPLEIFRQIIHILVSTIGVTKAWKYRQVSRLFASEIYEDIFANQPMSVFSSRLDQSVVMADLSVFLLLRTRKRLGTQGFLTTTIHELVEFLAPNNANNNTYRWRCAEKLCTKITDSIQPYIFKLIGNPEASVPKYIANVRLAGVTCLDKIAAAALVGNSTLIRNVQRELPWDFRASSVLFGHPLINATRYADEEAVSYTLTCYSSGTRIYATHSNLTIFLDALLAAIRRSGLEMINLMVPFCLKRLKLKKYDKNSDRPSISLTWLEESVRTGDVEIVTRILDLASHNPKVELLASFELACRLGHTQIVTLFLDQGKVNANRRHRFTYPLSIAVSSGHVDVIQCVLDAGARIDGPREGRKGLFTPLQTAVSEAKTAAVKLLLERGASLDERFTAGRDPLSLAANNKHLEIYKLLENKYRERHGLQPGV